MTTRRGLFRMLPALIPGKKAHAMTMPGKPVFGAGALRYPQIMSPNFNLANPAASPASSWALLQSGIAYLFGVVVTGGTIKGPTYIIDVTGAYFYSGTPAAGNLITSIGVTTATTDPTGLNAVLPGDTRYHNNGTTFVAQQSTQSYIAYLWQATSAAGPYTAKSISIGFTNEFTATPILQAQVNGGLGLEVTGGPVTPLAGLAVTGGTTTDTLAASGASTLHATTIASGGLVVTGGTTTDTLTATGKVTATGGTAGSPSLITTDTFTTAILTTPANWTVNNTLETRLEADGTVTIDGELTAAAAIATGATLTTLAAAYRPANRSVRMTACVNTGTTTVGAVLLNLTTAGVLTTFPAIAMGSTLNICARYPLNA